MPLIADMETPRSCDACGAIFDYSNEGGYFNCGNYHCDDCGSCYCEDCDPPYHSDSRIHSYDWSPYRFNPKGNYPAEVLLGVELEVGGSASEIADCVELVDGSEYHLYLKEDGSIDGAEIVAHPMTLAWAKDWRHGMMASSENKLDGLLRALRSSGCHVDPCSYGLHVHVSRSAFQPGPRRGRSATHQMAWLLFQYRNADQLQALARRESRQWASFRQPYPGELRRKAQRIERDDRYVAVNCNNERTYELRFFASTLQSEEYWAALEYADASVEYTRHLKSRDILKEGALQWSRFVAWLAHREDTYPNLLSQVDTLVIN